MKVLKFYVLHSLKNIYYTMHSKLSKKIVKTSKEPITLLLKTKSFFIIKYLGATIKNWFKCFR